MNIEGSIYQFRILLKNISPIIWRNKIFLSDFQFRQKEIFFYEYNFFAKWILQIRLEKQLVPQAHKLYPICGWRLFCATGRLPWANRIFEACRSLF